METIARLIKTLLSFALLAFFSIVIFRCVEKTAGYAAEAILYETALDWGTEVRSEKTASE